jgi:hypothetical protein
VQPDQALVWQIIDLEHRARVYPSILFMHSRELDAANVARKPLIRRPAGDLIKKICP